jgi:hypothetical protein
LSGETDLARLLAGLAPALDDTQYGFETAAEAPPLGGAFALIREDEGVTVIRPGQGWARITLTVQSSLAAIGLTAAVSHALAAEGIPANIVAAFHHDHIFVPWDRRADALAVLRGLAAKNHQRA